MNGKSRGLKKLIKYFNEATTSTSNILLLLLSGVLLFNFILYSKDLFVIVLLLFILSLAALFSFA